MTMLECGILFTDFSLFVNNNRLIYFWGLQSIFGWRMRFSGAPHWVYGDLVKSIANFLIDFVVYFGECVFASELLAHAIVQAMIEHSAEFFARAIRVSVQHLKSIRSFNDILQLACGPFAVESTSLHLYNTVNANVNVHVRFESVNWMYHSRITGQFEWTQPQRIHIDQSIEFSDAMLHRRRRHQQILNDLVFFVQTFHGFRLRQFQEWHFHWHQPPEQISEHNIIAERHNILRKPNAWVQEKFGTFESSYRPEFPRTMLENDDDSNRAAANTRR